MSAVTRLFSPPKAAKPDQSLVAAQQQQLAEERERRQKLERETEARRRALAGRTLGRVSLLGGPETGVKETLG
jgi:hypothetical protein